MTFISYAQNFEDVMLWRALKAVENGFYVDVGAQHPVVDSVSKGFYERGWRGIHIEPVPEYAELLRQDRPDETVLQIALADTDGTMELDVIAGTGLSTGVEAYARRHQLEKGFSSQRMQVPVLTLKSALHALSGREVHWLKIDVEGFEEKVLKGWDSTVLRPWILVIESTVPLDTRVSHESWEPILLAAHYQFVYFDGLNRFYLAEEHAELSACFASPPNVFDGFTLSGLANAPFCRGLTQKFEARERGFAAQSQTHIQWIQGEWDAAKLRIEDLSQQVGKLEAEREFARQHAEKIEAERDFERQYASRLGTELKEAHERETALQSRAEQLQIALGAATARVDELDHSSLRWRTVADELDCQLKSVYASYSWRIMACVRAVWHLGARVLTLPFGVLCRFLGAVRRSTRMLLLEAMAKVLTDPVFTTRAMKVVRKIPVLRRSLRGVALRGGLISAGGEPIAASSSHRTDDNVDAMTTPAARTQSATSGAERVSLSPRAARIYCELKRAIERGTN